MIVKIILGGDDSFSYLYKKDQNEFLIGVDGGSKKAKSLDLAVGDFDTVDVKTVDAKRIIKLNPIKDESDFDKAIDEARSLNPSVIYAYNFDGGRLDHYQAVLNTLARNKDLNIILKNINNEIKVINGTFEVEKDEYKYISFFALEDATKITLKGFKYPLQSHILNKTDNLCLSNEVEDKGIIEIDKPVLMFKTFDRK